MRSYLQDKDRYAAVSVQQGFALVLCLIILFAVTTLVFTSLSNISMLERRTASTATKNSAKQVASSAVSWYVMELESSNTQLMQEALNSDDQRSTRVEADLPMDQYTGTVQVQSLGFVMDTSSSLNADESAAPLQVPRFEVVGEGFLSSDERVKVVVGQGIDFL